MSEVTSHPPFKLNPKHQKMGLEKEFNRQLKDQQNAINKMDVKDWLKNREEFKNRNISEYNKKSNNIRKKYRDEHIRKEYQKYRSQGLSKSEAQMKASQSIKGQSALHYPDAIAGGKIDSISGFGNSRVNSSIGSQWKGRVEHMEDQIKKQFNIPPKGIDDIPTGTKMNIKLL